MIGNVGIVFEEFYLYYVCNLFLGFDNKSI